MSTRKLILLALACGLAILIAGSVQLLRIKNGESQTLQVGDSTELATATVRVTSGTVVGDQVVVEVRLAVAGTAAGALDRPVAGWSLLTGGLKKPVEAVGVSGRSVPSCAEVVIAPGDERDCSLAFPVLPSAKGTTYVTFGFAGSTATWQLGI